MFTCDILTKTFLFEKSLFVPGSFLYASIQTTRKTKKPLQFCKGFCFVGETELAVSLRSATPFQVGPLMACTKQKAHLKGGLLFCLYSTISCKACLIQTEKPQDNLRLFVLSGRLDSNQRPPTPEAGALTGLRYTPNKSLLFVRAHKDNLKNRIGKNFLQLFPFTPPKPSEISYICKDINQTNPTL